MNPEEVELVGLWSSAEGYFSTFTDEWIIFRPDGTGRLVFLSPYHDTSHHFRWRVASSGVVDLIGSARHVHETDDEQTREVGSGFHFLGVRYSVSEVERPPNTGNWMRELRLGLEMPWPTDLGYVTSDYEASEARLRSK